MYFLPKIFFLTLRMSLGSTTAISPMGGNSIKTTIHKIVVTIGTPENSTGMNDVEPTMAAIISTVPYLGILFDFKSTLKLDCLLEVIMMITALHWSRFPPDFGGSVGRGIPVLLDRPTGH